MRIFSNVNTPAFRREGGKALPMNHLISNSLDTLSCVISGLAVFAIGYFLDGIAHDISNAIKVLSCGRIRIEEPSIQVAHSSV